MRKVILHLHMSLDMVVSEPGQWMLMSDELLERAIVYYQTIDAVIFGSKTYPFLAEYWQEAEKLSASDREKEFAKEINKIKKYVLSRSAVDIVWHNSELLNFKDTATLTKSIARLKNQPGKDISVESGLGIWRLFLENSLFDELLLYVHPVVAGKGDKLFAGNTPTTKLKLISTKPFGNGVLELRYEKITDMAKINSDEQQIRQVIESWAQAVRNCNMDGILANHTSDILMYDVIAPFQNNGLEAYKKPGKSFLNTAKVGMIHFT
jgi:dihydrofolate reductase